MSELPDNVKYLALRYKSISKCSIKKALRWARRNWDSYNTYTAKNFNYYRHEKNGPYLEKEFIFRGFIPKDKFSKKPGFNYIESNQPINGKFYIFPKKLTISCMVKRWYKYPNAYNFHSEIGIPDFTKVDFDYSL